MYSRIRTCDICGLDFEKHINTKCKISNPGGFFEKEHIVSDGYDCDHELTHTERDTYDLCPSCSDKVLEFINELKIKAEMVDKKEVQNETMV